MVDTAYQKELEALARFYQGEGCVNTKGEIVASPSYLQQYKGMSEEQILFEYLREKRGRVREEELVPSQSVNISLESERSSKSTREDPPNNSVTMASRDNDRAPEPKPKEQPQKTSSLKAMFAQKRYESSQPADKTNDSRSEMSDSSISSISNRQLVDGPSSNIRQNKKEPETVQKMSFDREDAYSNKEKLGLNNNDLSGKQNLIDRVANKPTTVTSVIREARRNEDLDAEDGEEFKKAIAGNVSQVDKAFGERSNSGFSGAKSSSQDSQIRGAEAEAEARRKAWERKYPDEAESPAVSDKQEMSITKDRREQVGSRGHKEELDSSIKSSNSRKVDQDEEDEDSFLKGKGVTKEYVQQNRIGNSSEFNFASSGQISKGSMANKYQDSERNESYRDDNNLLKQKKRIEEEVRLVESEAISKPYFQSAIQKKNLIKEEIPLMESQVFKKNSQRREEEDRGNIRPSPSLAEKDDTRSERAAQSETSIADTAERKSTKLGGGPPNIPSMFKSIEEMLEKILKRQDILERNQQQIMKTQEEQDKYLKYIFGSLGGDISQLE